MKVTRNQSPSASAKATADRRSAVRKGAGVARQLVRFGLRPSTFGDRNGIALVITLIMLAIITFMAVTFLVLSQRERSSVTTAMDQKIARDASDAGFSRVSAELLTRMILHTNYQDFDLLVSTNYSNPIGFNPVFPAPLNPTNVNYDYLNGGGHSPLVNPQDREINIASLLFNPRPPVYVVTNTGTGQTEFRYYLDLNRNGRFDANGNGPLVVLNNAGAPSYLGTNGAFVSTNLPINSYLVTNYFVGDPEWIGVLARPLELHSADNQFISRYAYLVVPEGKTLDVNTMHNQAFTKVMPSNPLDGYMRNQGVGPWELNLAAFLTDLNTNIWPGPTFAGYNPFKPYLYDRPSGNPNTGLSFEDAYSILSYRYNNTYNSLFPATALFNTPVELSIDKYSDGPIMTSTTNNTELGTPDPVAQSWAGSENTNHFFSQQDLLNSGKTSWGTKTAPGFSGRLQQAGTSNDSYNAYTFYRMLSQLGTDSAVEQNKLNINYKNTDIHGNIVPGMETNHIAWTAEDFFTNAANRILATLTNRDDGLAMGVPLSTAYIPIYPTNYYTPAVHRALQLAANIFDASTNQTVPLVANQTNAFFPSVFRPIFGKDSSGQIYISGYKEVTDTTPFFNFQFWDFNTLSNAAGTTFAGINVYGVPWVIGAKKGFPNFNQFNFQTVYSLTRKLKLTRVSNVGNPPDDLSDFRAQQEFVMNAQNTVNMQSWNSYNGAWPMANRRLRLYGTNIFTVRMRDVTNSPPTGNELITPQTIPLGSDTQPPTWPGFNASFPKNGALKTLISSTNIIMDGNLVSYNPAAPGFRLGTFYHQPFRSIPQFYMYTTNRVVYAMIDESANRIVDFVNLDDSGEVLDFTGLLEGQAKAASVATTQPLSAVVMWRTNQVAGSPILQDAVSDGLNYQLEASIGQATVTGWNDDPRVDAQNQLQINGFRQWLLNSPIGGTNQAVYTPTYGITNQVSWEANDPLVHYTIPDLTDTQPLGQAKWPPPAGPNHRYSPWAYSGNGDDSTIAQSIAKKDPVAMSSRINGNGSSDAWDFPTNKFWNVGILGRVHRGTPWQTVYMKSPIIALKDWQNWSGSLINTTNPANNRAFADAALTMPNADYQLFDLFTTSPNPSASRGQLNINQTNLAAWSAVLSGVNVVTNGQNGVMNSTFIPPAGIYDPANPTPVAKIWQGIMKAKNNTTTNGLIFPNHTFQHVGDVLATPELSVASPYVLPANTGANDEVYERIPQQIMSLLTLNQSPRFVIYSFGQTLHPAADHPLVTGGTFNGLCTNYQITAESATRAVVRVEGTPDPKYQNGKVDSQGRSFPPHLVVEEFNVLSPD